MPLASSAASKASPSTEKHKMAWPSLLSLQIAERPAEKITSSPTANLRSGFTNTFHSPANSGSNNVTSILACIRPWVDFRARVPDSRAGMTLVSLRTKRSPGRKISHISRTWASSMCRPLDTNSLASPRGFMGRIEISSGGSWKSKSESCI